MYHICGPPHPCHCPIHSTYTVPKVPVSRKPYLFSAILNYITEPSCLLIPHTARFDLVYNTWWFLCKWAQGGELHFEYV